MGTNPKNEAYFFSKETIAATLKKGAGLYFGLSIAGAIILVIFSVTSLYDSAAVLGVAIAIALGINAFFIGAFIFAAGEAVENLQIIANNTTGIGIGNADNAAKVQQEAAYRSVEEELPEL